jgi:hypothetical protein
MAIKGKKKQQTRGSQARRRPAAPPRPVVAARRLPWYRTDRGRLLAIVAVAVMLGGAWWAIAGARAEQAQRERRQSAIEDYTGRVRALLQTVRPAADGMAQAPTTADAKGVAALGRQARSWIESLRSARAQAAGHRVAVEAAPADRLYGEAIDVYRDAAETYRLVPAAPRPLQAKLLERASAQRDHAGVVWATATQVLDAERARLELGPSGLAAPATPALGGGG